jgi:predicted small lipoprotein YifL
MGRIHLRVLLSAALLLGANACGQKGPLYYRDAPPPGYKAPQADPYKPVPYPKNPSADAERESAVEK